MKVIVNTAPTVQPISLTELKEHLRLDSGTLSDNTTSTQSIAPGSHAIAAAYTLVGTGVDVLGKRTLVLLESGTNGAGATVNVKIQDSDDNVTYTDVTDGAFTQVTTANDNATQEKEYTGIKQWIRTVGTVAVDACSFGTSVVEYAPTAADDDLLDDIIETATDYVEEIINQKLITQIWEYYLDSFPSENFIKLPFGNLQTTDLEIVYTDSDGDDTTMTLTTDYLIETNGTQCGRIVLPYGGTWPSFTAYPSKPIKITFACGYGDAGSDVPEKIRTAIKMVATKLYESRGEDVLGQKIVHEDQTVMRLLASVRLWDAFI